jgi:hypothetical protein
LISAGSVVGNNILEARTLKGSKVYKGAGLEVFWQLCSGAAAAMHIRDFLGGLVLFLLLAGKASLAHDKKDEKEGNRRTLS